MNEQITQTMIQAERIVRKFKFIIIICLVGIISFFAYSKISQILHEKSLLKNNELYMSLLLNPDEKTQNELLKSNPNLYSMYLFYAKNDKKQAIEVVKDDILKKIYEADDENGEYLKDFKKLKKAYNLMQNKKIKEANKVLDEIELSSIFAPVANNLRHYQGI